ncbi:Condensation domain-containing protein, partial [Clostridium cavendishii DSM 21758]
MEYSKEIIDSISRTKVAKDYWIDLLSQDIKGVSIYTDYPKSSDIQLESFKFNIDKESYIKLKEVTLDNDIAIYTYLLTILNIQFFKYTNEKEFLVGVPVYFKDNSNIGANKVLPVRFNTDDNMIFKDVLINTKNNLLKSYKHQIYPLDNLVKEKLIDNIVETIPINIIMKNIHNSDVLDYILESNNREITFIFENIDSAINIEIIYNNKLFRKEIIELFGEIYINIFHQVINNIQISLLDIEILPLSHKGKLINEFNNTTVKYPRNKTIKELFEKQVEKTPNNIALVYEDIELTYS